MIFKESEILVGINLLTLHPDTQLQNIYMEKDIIFCKNCSLDIGKDHQLFASSVLEC